MSIFSSFCAYSEDGEFKSAIEDCYKGNTSECEFAGTFLYKNKDYKKAEKYLTIACDGKSSKACHLLAEMYFKESLGKDLYDSAVVFFDKGCNLNYAGSCNNLGKIYETRKYGHYDLSKAQNSYEKACYMGFSEGCSNLGRILNDPKNPKRNQRKAKELFEKSCKADNPEGCVELAKIYLKGDEDDIKIGMKLYEKACA
ncbi:MAG: sel1 repeat family protein, partial [Succinivibrio sp.]|nr:sel1 repeat family protein [Succinivibrio sp.]